MNKISKFHWTQNVNYKWIFIDNLKFYLSFNYFLKSMNKRTKINLCKN